MWPVRPGSVVRPGLMRPLCWSSSLSAAESQIVSGQVVNIPRAGVGGFAVWYDADVHDCAGRQILQSADAAERHLGNGPARRSVDRKLIAEVADKVPGAAVDLILPIPVRWTGGAVPVIHVDGGKRKDLAGADGQAEGHELVARDACAEVEAQVFSAPRVVGPGADGADPAAARETERACDATRHGRGCQVLRAKVVRPASHAGDVPGKDRAVSPRVGNRQRGGGWAAADAVAVRRHRVIRIRPHCQAG